MTICSLCWKSYLHLFPKKEEILKEYQKCTNILDLTHNIIREIDNCQLFYEIFIISDDPAYNRKCDNCNHYSLDVTYKLYINNIYVVLLDYLKNNPNYIETMNNIDKKKLLYIIKRYNGDSKDYFYKLFSYPLLLEEANIVNDSNILKQNYLLKKKNSFNDLIEGHPKASHGWANESLNNIETLFTSMNN